MDTHRWKQLWVQEKTTATIIAAIDAALHVTPIHRTLTTEGGAGEMFQYLAARTPDQAKRNGGWLTFNGRVPERQFAGEVLSGAMFVLCHVGDPPSSGLQPPWFEYRPRGEPYDAAAVLALKIAYDAGLIEELSADGWLPYSTPPAGLFRSALKRLTGSRDGTRRRVGANVRVIYPSVDEMVGAYAVAASLIGSGDPKDTAFKRAVAALATNSGP